MEYVWVLDGLKSNGVEVMGLIFLKEIVDYKVEVGYWVVFLFWNMGIVFEVVCIFIDVNLLNS